MFKLIRFILLLIGKVLIWCLVVPTFVLVLLIAFCVEADDIPTPNNVFDWYEGIVIDIIDWFKDFWREA